MSAMRPRTLADALPGLLGRRGAAGSAPTTIVAPSRGAHAPGSAPGGVGGPVVRVVVEAAGGAYFWQLERLEPAEARTLALLLSIAPNVARAFVVGSTGALTFVAIGGQGHEPAPMG